MKPVIETCVLGNKKIPSDKCSHLPRKRNKNYKIKCSNKNLKLSDNLYPSNRNNNNRIKLRNQNLSSLLYLIKLIKFRMYLLLLPLKLMI